MRQFLSNLQRGVSAANDILNVCHMTRAGFGSCVLHDTGRAAVVWVFGREARIRAALWRPGERLQLAVSVPSAAAPGGQLTTPKQPLNSESDLGLGPGRRLSVWFPSASRTLSQGTNGRCRRPEEALWHRGGAETVRNRGCFHHPPAANRGLCADIDGFSLHAAVRVQAHDRKRDPYSSTTRLPVMPCRSGSRPLG